MARVNLEIGAAILREIKKLQKEQGLSPGRIVSKLLKEALALRRGKPRTAQLRWVSRAMNPRVDFSDKDAAWEVLDRPD